MIKKVNETGLNITVNTDDEYGQNIDGQAIKKLRTAAGNDGSVTLSNSDKNDSDVSENDTTKENLENAKEYDFFNKILGVLGHDLNNLSKDKKIDMFNYMKNFIYGINLRFKNDNDEVNSLYSGSDNRRVKYGIKGESEFKGLMKNLVENKVKKVNVKSINPKIKKKDLIKFITNKKNG